MVVELFARGVIQKPDNTPVSPLQLIHKALDALRPLMVNSWVDHDGLHLLQSKQFLNTDKKVFTDTPKIRLPLLFEGCQV